MSETNPTDIDKNTRIGDSISKSERRSRKDKSKSLSTKVVIRRLPPSMDEETFLNQIQPVPEYDYFYFVTADWSLGQNATSRAYINFLHEEDIFIFRDRFDGYVFVETKGGVEYPAIVEFAPFQGLPKTRSRKKDSKCNTIETDPDFIKFMASLSGDVTDVKQKPEMKMEYSYQIKDEKKITSTPLLEFIANKKVERKEERKKRIDERKRQRDDERNRKKSQVVKSIPPSIREQDEDGIVVRVVKSRARDRGDRSKKDRNSDVSTKPSSSDIKQNKPESNRDEKRRLEREQRDNRRKEERQRFREERDQKRQAERERNRKEREANKKEEVKTEKSSVKVETDVQNKGNQKEERVKRYSESRRARRESKEQLISTTDKSGKDNKIEEKGAESEKSSSVKCDESKGVTEDKSESAKKKVDAEKANAIENSKNNDDSSGDNAKESSSKSLTKEERLARRIRNKDRPSLQIYQPGRSNRRMSTKKDDEKSADDTSPKILSKPSSPTLSENSVVFPSDKSSTSSKKSAEKLRKDKPIPVDRVKPQPSTEKGRPEKAQEGSSKSSQPISKSNQSNDETIPAQRKVSRYSERRNKIKEKQNLKLETANMTTETVQKTDGSANNSGEINNSEIQ